MTDGERSTMRKLVWHMHMSFDGFVSGPGGELDWAGAGIDGELWEDIMESMSTADGALFGRVTYQMFEQYWPDVAANPGRPKHERDFSRWISETPKTVCSRTLNKLTWGKSAVLSEDVAEGVEKLKGQSGKNILLFGSCSLASHLWQKGLIDELQINIHPLILGVGHPLFKGGAQPRKLKLVKSRGFTSGIVGVRYRVG